DLFTLEKAVQSNHREKGKIVSKRVFVNYYFEVKYGQGTKASKYFEEIKAEALKLGISDVHMGLVEIGTNSLSTYVSLIFESADAFGRQWGGGSEYAVKSADWKALFKRINEELFPMDETLNSRETALKVMLQSFSTRGPRRTLRVGKSGLMHSRRTVFLGLR
ncbi:MAG: hypothetical protein EBV63_05985, partial [Actinobacteria bacterium]|nr:hypothetical protein [Actinomycetota bacterium]